MTQALPTVKQKRQPPGEAGARFTAREAVALARKYQDDPQIRSWVSHAVMDSCPNLGARDMRPSAQVQRAACLFKALRSSSFVGRSGWMPDQKGRENLDSPVLTLGDGTKRPFFAANDCSNRALALCAAYLTALNVIDCPVVLLAHGYTPGSKRVEHILLAVGQGKDWEKVWRMDPSQDLPFGDVTPWEWEYVVDASTGEVVCDDKVCLMPGGPKMSRIATVAAGGRGHVDTMNVTSGIPNAAGRAPNEADVEFWGAELGLAASNMRDASQSFERMAEALGRILSANGVPMSPKWTEAKQREALTTLAAANLAATFLQEGADGKRPMGFDDAGSWFLQSLPSDRQALGGDATSFWIENRATGARQIVNVASGNTAGQAWIIVGTVVAGLAIWGAVAWNVYRAIEAWKVTAVEVATVSISDMQKKCLEKNDAEACARLTAARAEIERARQEPKVEGEKTLQAWSDVAKAAVAFGAGVALFFGGRYVYQELQATGRVRGRSKNPPMKTKHIILLTSGLVGGALLAYLALRPSEAKAATPPGTLPGSAVLPGLGAPLFSPGDTVFVAGDTLNPASSANFAAIVAGLQASAKDLIFVPVPLMTAAGFPDEIDQTPLAAAVNAAPLGPRGEGPGAIVLLTEDASGKVGQVETFGHVKLLEVAEGGSLSKEEEDFIRASRSSVSRIFGYNAMASRSRPDALVAEILSVTRNPSGMPAVRSV